MIQKFYSSLFICLSILTTAITTAQNPGSLDQSFTGTGANYTVRSIIQQPDGKIILAGDFWEYNGVASSGIVRTNIDGSTDTEFNVGSGTISGPGLGAVYSAILQPDGKIIIGGYFYGYNGTPIDCVARLNTDGSLDTSFGGVPATTNGNIQVMVLQPDGKIIIGGTFSLYNGTNINSIARLNTDGTLDTAFNTGTGIDGSVYTISLQPDGKIIAGGFFQNYNETPANNIIRINSNGSLDTTFNAGESTGIDSYIYASAVQTDGKIVIGGYFYTYNSINRRFIARITSDGSLDESFNPGTGVGGYIKTILTLPNNKILIGGALTSYNGIPCNTIARINPNGSFDTSFAPTGTGPYHADWAETYSLHIQKDKKILLGGRFTSYDETEKACIVRLYGEPCTTPAPEGEVSQVISEDVLGNATIEDIVVTGENITWYASEEDITNNTPLPPGTKIVSGTTYYATQTIDECTSLLALAVTVTTTLSTKNFSNEVEFKYYPNPVKDNLRITSTETITNVKIYNLHGALLKNEEWNTIDGLINMEMLETGNYIVNIITNKTSKKIIVTHAKI